MRLWPFWTFKDDLNKTEQEAALRDLKLTCYSAKTKKILKENDDILINKT
jgi:hypothetical protein